MKLEIFKYEGNPEEPNLLALKPRLGGGIDLCVVNKSGYTVSHGIILKITEDGELHRYPNLDSDLGFRLGHRGDIYIGD